MSHETTISSITPSQPRRRKTRSFAFWQRLCLCWFLSLTLGGLSLMPPAASAEVHPLAAAPAPPPAPAPPVVPQGNVDLTVTALDTAAVVTDSQTLAISGPLGVTIKNLGSAAVNAAFRVIAFEDRNANGAFNQGTDLLLGSTDFPGGVAANGSTNLSIALSGIVTFKGNLIYVWVDSQNAIAETNENNNILSSARQTTSGALDLSAWQVVQFPRPGAQQFPAVWNLEAGNTVARQTRNSDPSIFLSDFSVSNEAIEGTLRVEDSGDDDYIGFAFGYQDAQHFYLFQWNQVDQGTAPRGMTVRAINADSPLMVPDFESGVNIGNRVRVIYQNSIPWAAFTTYQYRLEFTPGRFGITIKQGNTVLASTVIQDGTYLSGRFGFYEYSQEQVVYTAALGPQTPDLTASFIRKNDASFPASSELTARVGNGGGLSAPTGVKVSFYRGDPAAGGTLIGTTQTTRALQPGEYEDVQVVWNNPPTGLHPITVVADDNGKGQGTVNEGNEANNKAMANIALGIGPFTLVDDLLARFKDSAVDLRWSPIAGAAGYNVYRRTANGAPQLIKPNHPRANFADAGLKNDTTYYYTVRWVNASGVESGDGTEMSATPTSQDNRNDVPPTILSAPVTRVFANTPYSYAANARDPNAADTLTWSLPTPATEALRGLTINPANGLLQWTPTFAGAGYQNVTLRVADSRGRFATQTYRLFVEIPNSPPLVNAGPDQTVILAAGATLNGTAQDDGLPFGGTLTTTWTKVSGPGTVTFANASVPATSATFSAPGSYVLRLAASDSQLSRNDEVTVFVVSQLASRIYTLNSDFDGGQFSNIEHRIPHQLQLSEGLGGTVGSGPLNPVVKWNKNTFSVRPDSNQVMMTPAIIDVNADGIPDIVFTTFLESSYNYFNDGNLRAISGDDGRELWSVTNPAYSTSPQAELAVGDIDNDGKPEIIAIHDSFRVIAFEHDGTFKWLGPSVASPRTGGPTIADLDADGIPEIISGSIVLTNTGTIKWIGAGTGGHDFFDFSTVVDLDLDGSPEVIDGSTAYRANGSIYWDIGSSGRYSAVGNFDQDQYPEVVIVGAGIVYLLEHNGQIKWGPVTIPGAGSDGGPPTIADVDGDGRLDIGIAGGSSYVVFNGDGSIKWQVPIQDSSRITGSSVFDFNGDGSAEVVYGDEVNLRIYRGRDGAELFKLPKSSGTSTEIPVVADVDADGHADIIAVANRWAGNTQKGIYVISGNDRNWVNTRRIWNQHTYHITNVNEDGTIPRNEQPNWLTPGLNNFRLNTFVNGSPENGTWTVVFDSQIANVEWGRLNWNAQVCGDGALTVTAASSTDNTNFSAPQTVTRGADLTVPNGRYLRIIVSFRRATTGESPVLYDLAVGTDGYLPPTQPNTAPVVDAGTPQLIALPNPARLRPTVCDDTQPVKGTLAVTWSKFSGPGTVTFANANALVTTATFSAAGSYVLRLTANDGQFGVSDDITIEVENNNRPPVIASQPVTNGFVARPYSYQVSATDPNSGDILSYTLPTAPAGMTINAATGLIQWTPTLAQVGNQNVRVVVTDAAAATAEQLYTVTVTNPPPNHPPVIASTAPTGAAVEVPYTYAVIATDPDAGDVLSYSLDAAPAGMTINAATGLIQWFPLAGQVGNNNVTVRVRDVSNAAVTQSFTIAVIATVLEPTVAITSPAPGSNITQLVNIVGNVADPNNGAGPALTWTLAYRRADSNDYKTIGTGNGPVSNATLGQFDPTMLPNDAYYIRLQATKGIHIISTEAPYNVMGELKLGNFTVSFTDLTIPVAGIPLVITRSYDSLDTRTGEFGAGWRLGLAGNVRDTAREGTGDTFSTATRVYVTRPDGRRVGFTFAPVPLGGFFPVWRPVFRPDAGVTDTLEVADTVLFKSGTQFFDFSDPYNPDLYTFVTKEGVRYSIDEIEGLKKITDINGNTLTITPTGIVSSTGVALAFQRDAQNRITKITEPAPAVGKPGELRYVYDANGNLTQFIDQAGQTTRYSYQQAQFPNYLTKIEDPLNRPLSRNVFDAQGRLIGVCDANGDVATLNGCVRITPNAASSLQTIVNARGFRTDLILDERGNVLTERRFLDGANFLDTVRTYNANNNMLTEKDPANNTKSFTYDTRGNVLTATDPGNRTTTYTYSATCNKVVTVTDPASNVTAYEYDDKCNVRFVREPLGRTTEYRYNAQGQRSEMIDPVGSRWVWAYGGNGFLQSLTDPFSKATQFSFSASGELLSRLDRNNRRIDFEYDAAHRITKEKWNTAPQRITSYGYNATGQLTSAVDPDSALAIGYFNTGLVQSVDNMNTPGAPRVLISYSYDGNGNVTRVQDSLGGSTDYSYDGLDRLSRVTQAGTGVNEKRVDMVYDNASFLRELRRFSNLAGTQGVANTLFDYDCGGCAGRVKSIHHRRASNNAVIHDLDFTRDTLGNIVTATDAEGTHTYTYDTLRRLRTATHSQTAIQPHENYSYDAPGNRLTSHLSGSYTYSYQNGGNGSRLLQDAQFNYQYDDEGNLTRRTNRSTGSYVEFVYDHRNRMTSVVDRNSAGIEQARSEYVYDSSNRRIRAIENSNQLTFAYEGSNPTFKLSSAGTLISRRMYLRSLDGIIADEFAGTTRWFLRDQVGTVRDLIGNDGAMLNHYVFDSFGSLVQQANPSVSNDVLFTGREMNSTAGASYFRARHYDSYTGRFQQEDPIAPFGYEYVLNNPLSFTDRLGLSVISEAFTVNAIYGALAYKSIYQGIAIYQLNNCLKESRTRGEENECVRLFFIRYVNSYVGAAGVLSGKLFLTFIQAAFDIVITGDEANKDR